MALWPGQAGPKRPRPFDPAHRPRPQVEGGGARGRLGANTVHLNEAARQRLLPGTKNLKLRLPQASGATRDIELNIGGRVAAANAPLGMTLCTGARPAGAYLIIRAAL
ncbi:MAG: hypothetical protein E6R08_09055 [Nevskiaceae bacterium]|nr:MAG: hypothetical protein E6R08_09055 [Nevskiaceae bacterium]